MASDKSSYWSVARRIVLVFFGIALLLVVIFHAGVVHAVFPMGPRGEGYTTFTWGNMLVISRRTKEPELAWEYVLAICASGKKLRHTQINAVDYASQPIFETLLLRYPDIEKGRGPYPSV
ncbi:MAG TPA: hypothetical protein VNJ09_00355 [Chthonomonadales bacterium]|nr:hypothetical protein [Chthonomonadales bacterium]